jgi:hypothetical protein
VALPRGQKKSDARWRTARRARWNVHENHDERAELAWRTKVDLLKFVIVLLHEYDDERKSQEESPWTDDQKR